MDPYNSTQTPVPQNPLLEQNLHAYGNVSVSIFTELDGLHSLCLTPLTDLVQVPELDPDCDDCQLTFDFGFVSTF